MKPIRLFALIRRIAAFGAVAFALAGCVAGSGGYQAPSTPYKGNTPWSIASHGAASRAQQASDRIKASSA